LTPDGWKSLLVAAQKNKETFALLARLLVEQDQARMAFRDMGLGGRWPEIVDNVSQGRNAN